MGDFFDDDLDVIFAFHLLGLGPDSDEPSCSRCGRPVERDDFRSEEEYDHALAVGLCKECLEDTGL